FSFSIACHVKVGKTLFLLFYFFYDIIRLLCIYINFIISYTHIIFGLLLIVFIEMGCKIMDIFF
ncbi:hypothetical protein, partial [Helicobacter bilis]|uniref:hypothetical protein n=1 Tax=Helicobacter bilis TaxID=37372 RepID=UPI002A83360F